MSINIALHTVSGFFTETPLPSPTCNREQQALIPWLRTQKIPPQEMGFSSTTSKARYVLPMTTLLEKGTDFFPERVKLKEPSWQRKIRAMTYTVLSPFIQAISFVPSHPEIEQTFFIEKSEAHVGVATYTGYIRPYSQCRDATAHTVHEYALELLTGSEGCVEFALNNTLETKAKKIVVRPILTAFLGDEQTDTIALTFTDGTTQQWGKL